MTLTKLIYDELAVKVLRCGGEKEEGFMWKIRSVIAWDRSWKSSPLDFSKAW